MHEVLHQPFCGEGGAKTGLNWLLMYLLRRYTRAFKPQTRDSSNVGPNEFDDQMISIFHTKLLRLTSQFAFGFANIIVCAKPIFDYLIREVRNLRTSNRFHKSREFLARSVFVLRIRMLFPCPSTRCRHHIWRYPQLSATRDECTCVTQKTNMTSLTTSKNSLAFICFNSIQWDAHPFLAGCISLTIQSMFIDCRNQRGVSMSTIDTDKTHIYIDGINRASISLCKKLQLNSLKYFDRRLFHCSFQSFQPYVFVVSTSQIS